MKKISNTIILAALRQYYLSSNLFVKKVSVTKTGVYAELHKQQSLEVNNFLLARAYQKNLLFKKDLPVIKAIILDVFNKKLTSDEQVILKTICGIGCIKPKNHKQAFEMLKERGIKVTPENKLPDGTTLFEKNHHFRKLFKEAMIQRLHSALRTLKVHQIKKLNKEDFIFIDVSNNVVVDFHYWNWQKWLMKNNPKHPDYNK